MKILLADPSEVWRDALESQLKDHYEVLQCGDGGEVIPMLLEHRPDLLVLGMELPHIDGLSLLRMIRASGICVRILTAAYIYSEYDMGVLEEFKVSHMVRKPCTMCAVMSQIYQMLHYEQQADNTAEPDPTLLLLGLRMNLSGYDCLRTGIRLMRENPGQSLTKELYPGVAKLCGGTAQRVERAIRNVIRDAWLRRDDRIWMAYFPFNRNGQIQLPSNGDFITRIAFCGKDNKACG